MKSIKLIFKIIFPLGIVLILFQGCYTQVATVRDETYTSYKYDESTDRDYDSESDYYSDDDNNWRPRHYIGFTYYYPGWNSYWAWDFGYVYPVTYWWDPWYWGPVYYPYYSYYPYYWHHWYHYPSYAYYNYGGYDYSSHYYTTRNSGYQRSGNVTRDYGAVRTGNLSGSGTRSVRDNSTTSTRGDLTLPRTAGATTRDGNSGTVNSNRTRPTNRTDGVSTGRTTRNYQPEVQQPRHRAESGEENRENRASSSSRRGGYSRGSSESSESRSSERSSAPSYSPPPQRTSPPPSAPPQSSPAPSSRGSESRGSDNRSGDTGGRSRR